MAVVEELIRTENNETLSFTAASMMITEGEAAAILTGRGKGR